MAEQEQEIKLSTKKKSAPKAAKKSAKPAKSGGKNWTQTPPEDGRRVRRRFDNPTAKKIREAYANGWAVAALARKFKTSRYTITCIVRGVTYPDAGGPIAVAKGAAAA